MIQLKRRLKKKTIIIASSVVLLLIIGGIVTLFITHQSTPKMPQTIIESPGYTTVLPSGQSIVKLGGWVRVSPQDSQAVYAYNDTLDDVAISVSEQPLPGSFKDDVSGHVSELAKSYNATDSINASGTTVYIGTSAKGPQSVILTKDDLLILIKSEKQIKNATWSSYVASLQ
jgi:hypothetical protein